MCKIEFGSVCGMFVAAWIEQISAKSLQQSFIGIVEVKENSFLILFVQIF